MFLRSLNFADVFYAYQRTTLSTKIWTVFAYILFVYCWTRIILVNNNMWLVALFVKRLSFYEMESMTRVQIWVMLFAFLIVLLTLGKIWIQLFFIHLWVNSRTDRVLLPWYNHRSWRKETLNLNKTRGRMGLAKLFFFKKLYISSNPRPK